jgi:hypothetical protein
MNVTTRVVKAELAQSYSAHDQITRGTSRGAAAVVTE